MNAIIKLKAADLNSALIEHIRGLLNNDNAEVTISLKDNNDYLETLNRSRKDLEQRSNLIFFTMEELEKYTAGEKS